MAIGHNPLEISVIIPTLRRDVYLQNTLQDLCAQRGRFSFEILVIDQNRSPAHLRDPRLHAAFRDGPIRWVPCVGKNIVYARNLGLYLSRGRLLVFVDDDVSIPDHEFLAKHLEVHQQCDNGVAAVCGRETNLGQPEYTERLSYPRSDPIADVLHFPRNYTCRTEAVVLSTCNCSIKREALWAVNGFDERFVGASYGDDADLALRLAHAGYRIVYDPTPTLIHLLAPIGGLRLGARDLYNTFSECERVVSSLVFYLKHIHQDHSYLRRYFLYHHVLRKTILLKANALRPWRQPLVIAGLVQAWQLAREVLRQGHRCSFKPTDETCVSQNGSGNIIDTTAS